MSSTSSSSDDHVEQSHNLELEGKILGNYNVLIELGRGAYSIVWLVYNIEDNNFYAMKVQNPDDFKDGLKEINLLKKLPEKCSYLNHLKHYFLERVNNKKYLCSVYELQCGNLDGFIRKGKFKNGYPYTVAKKMMVQILNGVLALHKLRYFHGDIKPDNILLKGINDRDQFIINFYKEQNFFELYANNKEKYAFNNGMKVEQLQKIDKLKIRQYTHSKIIEELKKELETNQKNKYSFDIKYLDNIQVVLTDFGAVCSVDEEYEDSFGTRYYQSPENILVGPSSYPTDVWSLGCMFYELVTGKILFDPEKDREHSRDFYHLYSINRTCGSFPMSFLKSTKRWKEHFDKDGEIKYYKLKEKSFEHILEESQLNETDKREFISILRGMLQVEPKKRPRIELIINQLDRVFS